MDNYTIVDRHTCGHNLSIDLFGGQGSWTTWICNTCKTKRSN